MRSDDVRAVAALDDPQRSRLYAYVRSAGSPVTREDAAAAVGISRKLAAFHLDRLVDAGLLEPSFDRPAGIKGSIGRAPKRYRPAATEVAVTIPERHYDLAGEILVDAIATTGSDETVADAVARVARARGERLGRDIRDERRLGRIGAERALTVLGEVLDDLGFAPFTDSGALVERNCPFHRLATRAPDLVCGMNLAFVDGLLDGLEANRLCTSLEPADDRCYVVVRPRSA